MARAGYDPRDMANMFKTIEKQGGSGGPQWLSDHPNPGNRYAYINQEAQSLRVAERARRQRRRSRACRRTCAQLPPAPTTEQATQECEAARRGPSGAGERGADQRPTCERPSSRFTTYNEGNLFRVSVPSNWRELPGNNSVTFAPDGAYGTANRQSVFTHGVEVGLARNETHDLQTATDELLQSLAQGNPRLRQSSGYTPRDDRRSRRRHDDARERLGRHRAQRSASTSSRP